MCTAALSTLANMSQHSNDRMTPQDLKYLLSGVFEELKNIHTHGLTAHPPHTHTHPTFKQFFQHDERELYTPDLPPTL